MPRPRIDHLYWFGIACGLAGVIGALVWLGIIMRQ
jgi:hypothetical protein